MSRFARFEAHGLGFVRLVVRSVFASVLAAVLVSACLREHELLTDEGPGGGGNAGSSTEAGSPALPPWKNCYDALSLGQEGDSCVEPLECRLQDGCCVELASCKLGELLRGSDCGECGPAEHCSIDPECPPQTLCDGEECVPCPPDPKCPIGWLVTQRNGCPFCTPPSDCFDDTKCPEGMVCYAGLSCPPGCSDPSCCQGNICALPGCGSAQDADCGRVGCPGPERCVGDTPVQLCQCNPDSGSWSCSADGPPNECVDF